MVEISGHFATRFRIEEEFKCHEKFSKKSQNRTIYFPIKCPTFCPLTGLLFFLL